MSSGDWDYRPVRTGAGGVMQSALKKRRRGSVDRNPRGLMVRGVVVQNTTTDEESSPRINDPTFNATAPEEDVETGAAEIYISVITYAGLAGGKQGYLPNVLVTQNSSGMHEGEIHMPRAARVDVKGFLSLGSNPADLDGDHVLVGFLDDEYNMPVVIRAIPHPSSDIGKELYATDELGVRTRVQRSDGEPRYWKHRGVFWGVDTNGNWKLDLTKAHSGEYNEDGTEPDPPENGANGNFTVKVQEGATYTITSSSGTSIVLNADGSIDVNAGADSKVITVQGSGLDVQTDEVRLGDGAAEPAVLGQSWSDAHLDYDTALSRLLGLVATTFIAYVNEGVIPPPVPLTQPKSTAATLALTAAYPTGVTDPQLLSDLLTLTTALRGHLSDSVLVKD